MHGGRWSNEGRGFGGGRVERRSGASSFNDRRHAGSRGGYSHGGRDGRAYEGGSRRAFGGGRGYIGGGSYAPPRYLGGGGRVPVRVGHYRYGGPARYYAHPRTYVGFEFGYGYPSYYVPPAYVYDVAPAPVYVEPAPTHEEPAPPPADGEPSYDDQAPAPSDDSGQIDVTNEPPAGCYYYDSFCDRQFKNLDDYTDHLQSHHHSQTIAIVEKDTGETLRTLEFVGGYWQVQK